MRLPCTTQLSAFFCCHPILFQGSLIKPRSVSGRRLWIYIISTNPRYAHPTLCSLWIYCPLGVSTTKKKTRSVWCLGSIESQSQNGYTPKKLHSPLQNWWFFISFLWNFGRCRYCNLIITPDRSCTALFLESRPLPISRRIHGSLNIPSRHRIVGS